MADLAREGERDAGTEEAGLVLAVPAVVQENENAGKPVGTFLEGQQEYENLVTNSQYYEQVRFVGGQELARRQQEFEDDDSVYSIPQVISSNSSTTGLTKDSQLVNTSPFCSIIVQVKQMTKGLYSILIKETFKFGLKSSSINILGLDV